MYIICSQPATRSMCNFLFFAEPIHIWYGQLKLGKAFDSIVSPSYVRYKICTSNVVEEGLAMFQLGVM